MLNLTHKITTLTILSAATLIIKHPASAQNVRAIGQTNQVSEQTSVNQGIGNTSFQSNQQLGVQDINANSVFGGTSTAVGEINQRATLLLSTTVLIYI